MDIAGLVALWKKSREAPDETRGPLLLRVVWVLLAISMFVLTLRLWAKFHTTRRLYHDDALMTASALVGLAHAVMVTIAISHGLGRHFAHLSFPELASTIKFGAWSLLPGFLSPVLGRLSFCCTVLWLARTDPRMPLWPIYFFIALQIILNALGMILFYVQCGPDLDTFWTISKELHYDDYCWSPLVQTKYQYAMGAFNTLFDLFLAIVPAILIEHSRLSRKSKIGLACLLCLSLLAMVASIIKTYEAKNLSHVSDYTYDLCEYVIWISVELNIVIITASIPILRPLFRKLRRRDAPSHPDESDMASELPGWRRSHVPLPSALPSPTLSKYPSLVKMQSVQHVPQQSISSQAEIVSWDAESPTEITVITEVEVSYEPYESGNVPWVHAALIGLVQGEIANPKLVRA
ncbi:Hypothetical predicted protein [Lecanosticta acicola]|uniref:Rhodopsin domain-containing protein n=1 Tax=Lecanosticta acicola TaxID=111012 RepID=A0AAI9EEU1_9PEZI|nr:Hypothetical predicted protein [Lecanosticta acicola]